METKSYSSEMLNVQNMIRAAMANHELSFVSDSKVLKNPNRIVVRVTTSDEKSIILLKSYHMEEIMLKIEYSTVQAVLE